MGGEGGRDIWTKTDRSNWRLEVIESYEVRNFTY
jgi:hypothetical protein